MAEQTEPRIGVFVCMCGHNIAGTVDVERVAKEASSFPYVVFSTDFMFMCSDAGQHLIKDKIEEFNLDRVVVASCSPRMHEPTFRRVVEEANLNRYLFEQVNLREHVAWCHMREPELATEKAIDLVRMAVARSAKLEALPIKTVKIKPKTLIVGGGIAGIRAALDIADRGFEAVLVEKEPQIGGNVAKWSHLFPSDRPGTDILEPMIRKAKLHKNIRIMTDSKVDKFEGYVGNFEVTIKNHKTNKEELIEVGTVIVTTGFKAYPPAGQYGYGESPDILTLAEFQELKPVDELKRPSDGKPIAKVAFIGCVGSREPDVPGHEHCSRYCCSAVAKTAADVRSNANEVLVLYQDVRTYGKGHEEFYRLARAKHVMYSKFPKKDKPKVVVSGNKLGITWHDVLSNDDFQFNPDVIILATAMVPPDDVIETSKMFGLTRSGDGFFNPEHIKLAPLTTHTAGVMIAGAAQAAKNATEAVVDASGAAAKASALMAKGEVEIESTVARVDPDLCSSCHTCATACTYGAIAMDNIYDPPLAFVTEAKCHGCGTCAASCPSNAITMLHSTDDQILAMVEAYLTPMIQQGGKV